MGKFLIIKKDIPHAIVSLFCTITSVVEPKLFVSAPAAPVFCFDSAGYCFPCEYNSFSMKNKCVATIVCSLLFFLAIFHDIELSCWLKLKIWNFCVWHGTGLGRCSWNLIMSPALAKSFQLLAAPALAPNTDSDSVCRLIIGIIWTL
jgi:hypothetical protein